MENEKRIKVFIQQEVIPNYRIPLFQRLANIKNIDLTVLYGKPSKQQKKEGLENAVDLLGFRSIELRSPRYRKLFYNCSLIINILLAQPDIVISGKFCTWDGLVIFTLCKFLKIKFLWWSGGIHYADKKKIKEIKKLRKVGKIYCLAY